MSTELTTTFDYASLPAKTATSLQKRAAAILSHEYKGLGLLIAQGKELKAAQDELSDHHDGMFCKWVDSTCPFAKSSAYKLMAVYRRLGGSCPPGGQPIPILPKAAYLLSEESTPEGAVKEAVSLAKKGVQVTHPIVKKLIENLTVPESDEDEDECEDDPEEAEEEASEPQKDQLGNPLPDHAVEVFAAEGLLDEAICAIDTLRRAVNAAADSAAGKFIKRRIIVSELREMKKDIKAAQPYCICPKCSGERCTFCWETGVVPQRVYKQTMED